MFPTDESVSDWPVVQQCLAGLSAGWDVLYRRYHGYVVQVVAARLPWGAVKQDLVDDIAHEVWVKLYANPNRLRMYDPARGSLRAFLFWLACYEAQLYRRRVRLHKLRLVPLGAYTPPDLRTDFDLLWVEWNEFLSTCSAGDREFVSRQSKPGRASRRRHPAEQKRSERLRKKVHAHFGSG